MKSSADCGHAHQFILSFMCLFKYSVSLTKLNYVLFLGICTVAKKNAHLRICTHCKVFLYL